jgi:microcystin degradation protein MlrC
MRIAVGGLMHETHTFSNVRTYAEPFTLREGDDILELAGTNASIGGAIDGCRVAGAETVPLVYGFAIPAGYVDRAVYQDLVSRLTTRLAAAGEVDGVVLTLHGAMVVDGIEDAELDMLERVRAVVGSDLPVAVTLDFHANTSRRLTELATIIVGYDTYPHVDPDARAVEAVELLIRTIRGEITPTIGFAAPPLMPVPQAQMTGREPFTSLFAHVHALEEAGEALSITLAGGFAYSDVPMAGLSVTVVTDNDPVRAQALANELAAMAWDRREQMLVTNTPVPEAVAAAIAEPTGPVVLVDVGDNIGGGTPGDGTVVLAELIRQDAQRAVVVIADPEAADLARAVGVGAEVDLLVGGKVDRLHGDPVRLRGVVRSLHDGRWVHEGPENAGVPVDSGPTAVVVARGVTVVLSSRKTMPGDQQQLKSVGIEPTDQHILVMKAAIRWRGGFESITARSIDVDTPGLGTVNLANFPYQRIRRPIFPLDPEMTWSPETESPGP